jgi:hypothetical protein
MREINEFANGIRGILSKIVQSSEFKRAAEEISQPPRDHAADYSRQLNLEAAARDRIPRESLHRLTEIEESTRITKEELHRFRADFIRLDEEFSDFKRSQQAWFIPWIGIALGAIGTIVSIFASLKLR